MSRVFFNRELDTVATYWRIFRPDGVALGFSTHNRALWFGGIYHRAAPGMIPSAIRRTSRLSDDSAEVEGSLSHDAIREADLAAGLYDEAQIVIGAVDWETLEHEAFYSGSLGQIIQSRNGFQAELRSVKSRLDEDLVPRTSPTCRAAFCGPGCGLSQWAFTRVETVTTIDLNANAVSFAGLDYTLYIDGSLRFLDGPQTGKRFGIVAHNANGLVLDYPLAAGVSAGTRCELVEGCDHTIATCSSRFDNAANFRGEPFLPGNDLLARYGLPNG